MKGRIRTIKPEALLHEGLWDLELETGLPIFRAFVGLWCFADREGRFEWRPRRLKTQVVPYWDGDFSRVLDALASRGFVRRYAAGGRDLGVIDSFGEHQAINGKEPHSRLPAPPEPGKILDDLTRGSRVDDASSTRPGKAREVLREGKGREGKGREVVDARERAPLPPPPTNELERNEADHKAARAAVAAAWRAQWEPRAKQPTPKPQVAVLRDVASWLVDYRRRCPERSFEDLATSMVTGFLIAKSSKQAPPAKWLAEDPGRYLEAADEAQSADRKRRQAERIKREESAREAAADRAVEADAVDAKAALAELAGTIGIPLSGPARAWPGPAERQRMSRDAEEQRRRVIEAQAEQLRASGGGS